MGPIFLNIFYFSFSDKKLFGSDFHLKKMLIEIIHEQIFYEIQTGKSEIKIVINFFGLFSLNPKKF